MGKVPGTWHGSGVTPACAKCGDNTNVVRMYHGHAKFWVCKIHYKIQSTETVAQSLRQRLLHKAPEQKTFDVEEILPNRQARRAHGSAKRIRS